MKSYYNAFNNFDIDKIDGLIILKYAKFTKVKSAIKMRVFKP